MHVIPMPEGVHLSPAVPESVRISIADAVLLFGRMEQKLIEISWILLAADLKQKLRLARNPASENFLAILKCVELAGGDKLSALERDFKNLSEERNLMVHGSWNMADDKPWVVWHKFLEDDESIIGEYFEQWRFERFALKGNFLMEMLTEFHRMLEEKAGKKTSALSTI